MKGKKARGLDGNVFKSKPDSLLTVHPFDSRCSSLLLENFEVHTDKQRKSDREALSAYRPFSISDIAGKLLEKLFKPRLTNAKCALAICLSLISLFDGYSVYQTFGKVLYTDE